MILELALAILIIAFLAGMLLPQTRPVVAKARMVEALHQARSGKLAIVEHFAITGRPLETDLAGRARAAEASDAPEYEKHLSAARAFAAVAAASGQSQPDPDRRGDDSPFQVRAGVRDGSVMVMGRMVELARPYAVTFVPAAAAAGDAAATVQWVCGGAPVPAGSVLLGQRVASDIAPGLLPHTCRGVPPP